MARLPEGWSLERKPGHLTYDIRFTFNGRRKQLSTRKRDRAEAAQAAPQIYADYINAHSDAPRAALSGNPTPLAECIAKWIASHTDVGRGSLSTYESYGRLWIEFFGELDNITTESAVRYMHDRLKKVLARTVSKELSALRRFVKWALRHHHIPGPVDVPFMPRGEIGTPTASAAERHAEAPELSAKEIERLLARLPEWSEATNTDPFPVRAYFRVLYETAFTPAMLARLESPTHYSKGRKTLTVTKALDRGQWAREVPLSDAARKALDGIVASKGLIFGRHDYAPILHKAAMKVFPRSVADVLSESHIRANRIRHLLQVGSLSAVMYATGIKNPRTLMRYAQNVSSKSEAELMLGAISTAKTASR